MRVIFLLRSVVELLLSSWYTTHVRQFFFSNSLVSSRYLYLFYFSFNFTLWSPVKAKSTILQVLSFLLIIIRSGRLAEIRWSVCMSKSHWSLCVSFPRTDAGLCIYHLFVWSNSPWITFTNQLCLVFLWKFAAFAYYVIDGFVSITT